MKHNQETSTNPHGKIALDFFGPLPGTNLGNKYILYASRPSQTSSCEMIFGRDPNIVSVVSRSLTLTYADSIKKWKIKHVNTIRRAKEITEVKQDKANKRSDENIVKGHLVYKIGHRVKWKNNIKQSKLGPS